MQQPPEVLTAADLKVVVAMKKLKRVIAAVQRPGEEDSEFDRVISVLKTLSRKEDIPLAIVGGMAAIHHGYERLTHDIEMVVAKRHLDSIVQVAPKYGIKVAWHGPDGWHKLDYEGLRIEIVPEGGKAREDAPTAIPGPKKLGVREGMNYANLAGWLETKLSSYRAQDRADVVQVLKRKDTATIEEVRDHIASVHAVYLRRFDQLRAAAEAEKKQEKNRGGGGQ